MRVAGFSYSTGYVHLDCFGALAEPLPGNSYISSMPTQNFPAILA